jgi:hypothetical protein
MVGGERDAKVPPAKPLFGSLARGFREGDTSVRVPL